jgi:polyisoprenoid-binding protein YceI
MDHSTMSTTDAPSGLGTGTWTLDPANSTVEFRTKTFWGLMTVKGTFSKYEGHLDLSGDPAIKLTIDAASLDTKNKKRDTHLRSEDFFGVEKHPEVTFEASDVSLDGEQLRVGGKLAAGGSEIPVQLTARVVTAGEGYELDATVIVDHRQLGMTFNQAGMIKDSSTLIVKGRLVKQD